MPEKLDDDFCSTPPSPERVAARALILASVSCRALIEKDAGKPGADELRQKLLPWLESVGAAEELEPHERELIETDMGSLDPKKRINASWQSEGMVVLAWALGYSGLPIIYAQCEPSDVANNMGFLESRNGTSMNSPHLLDPSEIDVWRDTYLTLHWRLRQFSLEAKPIDFVKFVAECKWGPLRLDHLQIIKNDLGIDGKRIDKVDHRMLRHTLSITQERHQAFNWLSGNEQLYSQVTTDT